MWRQTPCLNSFKNRLLRVPLYRYLLHLHVWNTTNRSTWLEQLFIDKAPTVLLLLAVVLFAFYGRIVWNFIGKGFYRDRWYGRTPLTRSLTIGLCLSAAQSFYLHYAVVYVMGSQIIQKGNSTFSAILMTSYFFFLLGYGFHEIPFSGLHLFRQRSMGWQGDSKRHPLSSPNCYALLYRPCETTGHCCRMSAWISLTFRVRRNYWQSSTRISAGFDPLDSSRPLSVPSLVRARKPLP